MAQFHHANLGVTQDGVEDETRWLVDILGYHQISVATDWPSSGPYWFEAEDGTQIHLSRDPDHRAPALAHVALVYDDLSPIRERLESAGLAYDFSDRGDVCVVNCHDPAGNRWELRQNLS